MWKSTIKCDHAQKFREINSLVIFLATLWKSTIKRDHAQKFPGNQLFSKNIDLTEKMVIVFLTTFQHSVFSKNVDFCENSVKSIHLRMS